MRQENSLGELASLVGVGFGVSGGGAYYVVVQGERGTSRFLLSNSCSVTSIGICSK